MRTIAMIKAQKKYSKSKKGKNTRNRIDRKYRKTIRFQLMLLLGGVRCKKCGNKDIRCLQFDHINGGGCKELSRFKTSTQMVRYYINHPKKAKQKLQVLCSNCNWIKKWENNENA